MRATSLEIHHRIKSDGILKGLRLQVYEVLLNHGAMTGGEIWQFHFREQLPKIQRSSISSRMSELERMGAIRESSQRPCKLTGNNAVAWEVTDKIPLKLVKPPKRICCCICKGRGWVVARQKSVDPTPALF